MAGIFYKIDKFNNQDECLLVSIAVPGERWEVELFHNGEIEDEEMLKVLFEKFAEE